MQFRVQFLDSSARVIRELVADARNAADAIARAVHLDWPARPEIMRVPDLNGFAVHSTVKRDTKSSPQHMRSRSTDARSIRRLANIPEAAG